VTVQKELEGESMLLTIPLTAGLEQILRAKALGEGKPIEVLAAEWLASAAVTADEPDWIDTEYHAQCEADEDEVVSIEQVRKVLSKIPGNMTVDFIAEREERQ